MNNTERNIEIILPEHPAFSHSSSTFRASSNGMRPNCDFETDGNSDNSPLYNLTYPQIESSVEGYVARNQLFNYLSQETPEPKQISITSIFFSLCKWIKNLILNLVDPKKLNYHKDQTRNLSKSDNNLHSKFISLCSSLLVSICLLFFIFLSISIKSHITNMLTDILDRSSTFKDPKLVAEFAFTIGFYSACYFFVRKMAQGIWSHIFWIGFSSTIMFYKFRNQCIGDTGFELSVLYSGLLVVKIINIINLDIEIVKKLLEWHRKALKKKVKLYLFLILIFSFTLISSINLLIRNSTAQKMRDFIFWKIHNGFSENEIAIANLYNTVISCSLIVFSAFAIQFLPYSITLSSDRIIECYDEFKSISVTISRVSSGIFAIISIFTFVSSKQDKIDIMLKDLELFTVAIGYFMSFFIFCSNKGKDKKINRVTKKEEPYTYYSLVSFVFHILFFSLTLFLAFIPDSIVSRLRESNRHSFSCK